MPLSFGPPAIFGTEFKFGNREEYSEAALVPEETDPEAKSVPTPAEYLALNEAFDDSDYADALRIVVRADIRDVTLYTGGDGYGLCIYTVDAFETIDTVNVTDFLSDSTELTLVEYLSSESDIASLGETGDSYTFWLYTSEDHTAVNPLGQEAGIVGAWEVFGKLPTD